MRYLLPIFASVFLLMSCHGSQQVSQKTKSTSNRFAVNFAKSDMLMDALEQAEAQNKLVFIDLYTDWCLPCKMMDEEVFTDAEVGQFLNQNFINMKVNAEKGNGPKLATIFQVHSYPTLLFLDANGKIVVRKEGAAFHTELRRLGENAIAAVQ